MNEFLLEPSNLLMIVGMLVLLSVLGNRVSEKFGLPILLVFISIGMIAGSDGIGRIAFENYTTANFVGIFALAFILFSGGLDTNWKNVRPVLVPSTILATAGVAVTAVITGLFAWLVVRLPARESMLLGTIVSSTDAAAVFGVLRSKGVGLKGNLKPLLEMESGSNDPMAVFLTTSLISILGANGNSWVLLSLEMIRNFILGITFGLTFGYIFTRLLRRIRLEYEGLYPVLSMSMVLLSYGFTAFVGGNGFLAVYVCGIFMGNKDFPNKRFLAKFHDGFGWMMQVTLFLTLGLLVSPTNFPSVAVPGILVAIGLMFVARPLSVFLGLYKSKFSIQDKLLVSWAGLRGAVPIVLATFPLMEGLDPDKRIFNMVFFIVLASVIIQGKTLMPAARLLKIDEPISNRPKSPFEFEKSSGMKDDVREIDINPDSTVVGKSVSELGLPRDVLILLIRRGADFVVPRGYTLIEPYDTLTIIASQEALSIAVERLSELKEPDTNQNQI